MKMAEPHSWVIEAQQALNYLLDKQSELEDDIEALLNAIEQEDEAQCERLVIALEA